MLRRRKTKRVQNKVDTVAALKQVKSDKLNQPSRSIIMLNNHKRAGLNIYDFKVKIACDSILANIYYREWKKNSYDSSYKMLLGSSNDYLVIFENEVVARQPYYKKSHLAKMSKDQLYSLLEDNNHPIIYTTDLSDMTKGVMVECLLPISNKEYYANLYESQAYRNLPSSFSICGYSQGDYCKVKIVGNVEKWVNKEYLTNIFFNSPIYSNIEIFCNGEVIEEFSLDELEDFNKYNYNKNDIITMLSDFTKSKEYHNLFLEYLNDNLQDYL